MSGTRNVSIMVVAFLALALVSVTSGASEWELSPSSERAQLADVSMQEGVITLTPRVEFKIVRVTINGPEGTVFEKRYKEAPIAWHLDDSQGKALADGRYTFEVRFLSGVPSDELEPSAARETSKVINGGFSIKNGVVNTDSRSSIPQRDVASLRKPMQNDFAKAYDYTALYVSEKIGIGIDNSDSLEAELHIQQAGGSTILLEERVGDWGTAIEGQWRISGRDTLFTIGQKPNGTGTERENIVIEENAPQNQLYMDSTGRIGFGTAAPTSDFHIASTNGAIRIEDTDGSTWTFIENNGDMQFVLTTAQSGVGTAGTKMVIEGTGEVGIGTTNPNAPLHIFKNDGTAQVLVQEGNGTSALRTQFRMVNNGPVNTQHETGGAVWRQQFQNNAYALTRDGTGGNEMTIIAGSGNMTIRGSLFTGGPSCGAGCDAVLGPDFTVESIEEHAAAMWSAGFLPAIGATLPNEPINLTEKMGGVLNELEKAHIYIEQLHQDLAQQKELFRQQLVQQTELFHQELAQQKEKLQRLEVLLTEYAIE